MRRYLTATLAMIMASIAGIAQNKWVTTEHDFGAFDEDMGMVFCEFKLVNTGSEPIAITGVRANCGCTKPEYSKSPVAPGDTAIIKVGYDPKGRPGRFAKRVYVDCSADPARSVLTIQGTVIGSSNTLKSRYPIEVGPVRMRTSTIAYGKVLKGETMGQYIDAYNASPDTLRPRTDGAPKYINVMVEPKVVPPGEQFVISTVLHSNLTPEWGITTDSLTFYPDASATNGQKVETVVILEEDFSKLTADQMAKAPLIDVDKTSLDLEKISRTSAPIKEQFTISNAGKTPLIIRAISCPDPAVNVDLKERTIKPGKSAKVNVTVTPSLIRQAELLNARINIIANDPIHPSTIVRVVGEL